jgi:beta-lactamase superfamily II metal-dependent hydrolase
LVALSIGASARALEPEPGSLFVRVLDVGPGLACVVVLPDGRLVVYDAGHWNTDRRVLEEVEALADRAEGAISLLVLSHSDADHLGAVDELCDAFRIERILHTGMVRSTATWRDADAAIADEVARDGAIEINLSWAEFPPGATYRFGEAFATFVCGFGEPPDAEELDLSESRNAVSIVLRLQFADRAVLFTGDAVGRHIASPDDELIATERFMVEMAAAVPIRSDVLIAPHHGARNASTPSFVAAVDPAWVVFSAGHDHEHPRAAAAQVYLDHGLLPERLLRTDRGDGEGGKEWTVGGTPGATDRSGDDDVDILIRPTGELIVEHRFP